MEILNISLRKYQNEKIRITPQFRILLEDSWGSSFLNNFEKFTLTRIFFFKCSSKPLWWSTFSLNLLVYVT